jgi:hypothetical protein
MKDRQIIHAANTQVLMMARAAPIGYHAIEQADAYAHILRGLVPVENAEDVPDRQR